MSDYESQSSQEYGNSHSYELLVEAADNVMVAAIEDGGEEL
ncbi:hypothetical protein [Rhodopseudomonas palustris]|uniref:Uncharacterized protein n=1 Tax=Rhodopseudomonas palustris (strain ATCC BAA-98 / CGA009) TaxID=258594 RepID=A0AAE9Y2P6_RHOPA|nr:hypothetical protein [Rhodopseudomonas palustris]WAB75550.1 hypothetical protein OR798_13640 [Rhodopseudomonas palustris]WCL92796.1 hypothetical protein TX73_013635 [Rhodopseudomonas palustris CGA009]